MGRASGGWDSIDALSANLNQDRRHRQLCHKAHGSGSNMLSMPNRLAKLYQATAPVAAYATEHRDPPTARVAVQEACARQMGEAASGILHHLDQFDVEVLDNEAIHFAHDFEAVSTTAQLRQLFLGAFFVRLKRAIQYTTLSVT